MGQFNGRLYGYKWQNDFPVQHLFIEGYSEEEWEGLTECTGCTFCLRCDSCPHAARIAKEVEVLDDAYSAITGDGYPRPLDDLDEWERRDRRVIQRIARLYKLGPLHSNISEGVDGRRRRFGDPVPGMSAVYVFTYGDEQVCKVGVSSNPRARLKILQSGNPWKMWMSSLFWVPNDLGRCARGAMDLEHEVHEALRAVGIRHTDGGREWFDVHADHLWRWLDGARQVMSRIRWEANNR